MSKIPRKKSKRLAENKKRSSHDGPEFIMKVVDTLPPLRKSSMAEDVFLKVLELAKASQGRWVQALRYERAATASARAQIWRSSPLCPPGVMIVCRGGSVFVRYTPDERK